MAYPGTQHVTKTSGGISLKYLCHKHGYIKSRFLRIEGKTVPFCTTCLHLETGFVLTEAVKGRKATSVEFPLVQRRGPYPCQGCLATFETHADYETHRGACPSLMEGDT